MATPKNVDDQSFDNEVLQALTPVLVDFWAPWCGPCRIVSPVVEELAEEYDGRVQFAKVNVDDSPETAAHFGIRSIPTLLIFKEGKPVDQVIGAVPKRELQKHLEAAIS